MSRIAFCLSLAEPAIPNPATYQEDDREFNRYTLLGEWDDLYVALIRQRLAKDGLGEDQMEEQFRAHINRGVIALFGLIASYHGMIYGASRQLFALGRAGYLPGCSARCAATRPQRAPT